MLSANEIKKALECCAKNDTSCDGCPLNDGRGFVCIPNLSADALEYINHLENKLDTVKEKVIETTSLVEDDIKTAKVEAYEEVEKKIEETTWYHINKNGELVKGANSDRHIPLYKAEDIYNLLNKLKSESAE